MVGLQMTVHLKKHEWLETGDRYVPVRIHFTEDCLLQEKEGNPEWLSEVNNEIKTPLIEPGSTLSKH